MLCLDHAQLSLHSCFPSHILQAQSRYMSYVRRHDWAMYTFSAFIALCAYPCIVWIEKHLWYLSFSPRSESVLSRHVWCLIHVIHVINIRCMSKWMGQNASFNLKKITPIWLNLSTGRWRWIRLNVKSLQRRCYHEIKFTSTGSFVKLTRGLYLWITLTQLLVKLMSWLSGTLIICTWHVLRIFIKNAFLEIFSVPSEDRSSKNPCGDDVEHLQASFSFVYQTESSSSWICRNDFFLSKVRGRRMDLNLGTNCCFEGCVNIF